MKKLKEAIKSVKESFLYHFKKVQDSDGYHIDIKKTSAKISKEIGAREIQTYITIGLQNITKELAKDITFKGINNLPKDIYTFSYPVKLNLLFSYNVKTKSLDIAVG